MSTCTARSIEGMPWAARKRCCFSTWYLKKKPPPRRRTRADPPRRSTSPTSCAICLAEGRAAQEVPRRPHGGYTVVTRECRSAPPRTSRARWSSSASAPASSGRLGGGHFARLRRRRDICGQVRRALPPIAQDPRSPRARRSPRTSKAPSKRFVRLPPKSARTKQSASRRAFAPRCAFASRCAFGSATRADSQRGSRDTRVFCAALSAQHIHRTPVGRWLVGVCT